MTAPGWFPDPSGVGQQYYDRKQYARSAAAHAAEVLLAADATPGQRQHAGYYLDDAHGMLAAA